MEAQHKHVESIDSLSDLIEDSLLVKFNGTSLLEGIVLDSVPRTTLEVGCDSEVGAGQSAAAWIIKPVKQAIGEVVFNYFSIVPKEDAKGDNSRVIFAGQPDVEYAISAIPLIETARNFSSCESLEVCLILADQQDALDVCTVWSGLYRDCLCDMSFLSNLWIVRFNTVQTSDPQLTYIK